MREYQAGDSGAFARMYPHLVRRLRDFLRRYAFDAATIEDLVHDTFVRAHAARTRFEVRGGNADQAVRRWYTRIAHNLAVDRLREHHDCSLGPLRAELLDPHDPEQELAARRATERAKHEVARALGRLPARQRDLIAKTKLQGVPSSELARTCGVKPGAMRVRVHRAFVNFREALQHDAAARAA